MLLLDELLNIGTLGGIFFFLSWLIQAWETKVNKESIVSIKFWSLRALGVLLLTIYSIQIKDMTFVIMYGITGAIVVFNIFTILDR